MSEHTSHLTWTKTSETFTYETYNREHQIQTGNGLSFAASSAPDFKGDPKRTNPEELLVAALSSCHMLTFLAVASKKGFDVVRYEDNAVGHLEKPADGPMHVTRCTLQPKITFAGGAPDAETLRRLHETAHRGCFIANSVKTLVEIV